MKIKTVFTVVMLLLAFQSHANSPTKPYPLTYLEMVRIQLALEMIGQKPHIEVITKGETTLAVDITYYLNKKNPESVKEAKRLEKWARAEVATALKLYGIDKKKVKVEVNFDGVQVPKIEKK